MRLGEIKNILYEVLTDGDQILIDHEPVYGGQAHDVRNYKALIAALDILAGLSWNDLDYTNINTIKDRYHNKITVQLSQGEFNQLNQYIATLNQKLPMYISVLDIMTDKQDKHIINVKLSETISDLNDLSNTNKRLNKIFTLFNIDGQFDFKGFDRGTEWYVMLASGVLSYKFCIAGLNIAQKFFDMRKTYFESSKAELDLQAALDKEKVTETDLKRYMNNRMKLLVRSEVEKVIENIGVGTNEKNEITVKVIKATKALIFELDNQGTEFHLSLNPPEYATEKSGTVTIDYKKMPTEIAKRKVVKRISKATKNKK